LPSFLLKFVSAIQRPVPLGNLHCTGFEQNLLSCHRVQQNPCSNSNAAVTCVGMLIYKLSMLNI